MISECERCGEFGETWQSDSGECLCDQCIPLCEGCGEPINDCMCDFQEETCELDFDDD